MWMGATRLERAEPHGSSPGRKFCFTAHWTFIKWAHVGWKGGMYVERTFDIRVPIRRLKVNGGHATGTCWAPGQFTWIDNFTTCCHCLKRGPTWDASRPPAHQDHPGDDVVALNCLLELKNRPTWTALSGLKWAAGCALAAHSDLQQLPYMQLSAFLKNFYILI
jgi:hypothetical protein